MTTTHLAYAGRPAGCPSWCVQRHGIQAGEDDFVHVSAALLVRGALVRLCTTVDPTSQHEPDGPYVLVGAEEYSLDEADLLIDALTTLVDAALGVTRREGA